jgi:peptidylprolyl isomerase
MDEKKRHLFNTATAYKAEGNALFYKKKNSEAAILFRTGVQILKQFPDRQSSPSDTVPTELDVTTLTLSLHLNLAAALLNMEDWEGATKASSKALALDENNIKGRYRKGVALFHLNDLERAKEHLSFVAAVDPENKAAR